MPKLKNSIRFLKMKYPVTTALPCNYNNKDYYVTIIFAIHKTPQTLEYVFYLLFRHYEFLSQLFT
jgi:hypothetical protein